MKKQSKNIYSWGNVFLFTALTLFVFGVLAWLMGEGTGALSASLPFFIASPVLKGLALLVKNAEEEMDDRERLKLNADEEQDL